MSLYKLREAQRTGTAFGGPSTMTASDPTRMVIDPTAARPPHILHHHSVTPPQRAHPSAVPPHAARIVGTRPIQPQPIQHMASQPAPAPNQPVPPPPPPAFRDQTPQSHVEKLEHAHFGHSLYFIEHLFPSKLWRILDDAERCGYDNVISWVDNGMAFQIREYYFKSVVRSSESNRIESNRIAF